MFQAELLDNATEQQKHVIRLSVQEKDLSINAGPGCGKSDVLRRVAVCNNQKRILNLCFNRNTKLQADERMPSWTKNYTFHGVAFAQTGKYYSRKLNIALSPKTIAKTFDCDLHTATVVKYTLRSFAVSDSPVITGWNVPREAVASKDKKDHESFKDNVVTIARKTWLRCMDYKDKAFGVEHDFYLKEWVEEGCRLPGRYDLVLVDEGQDMVPVNIKAMSRIYGQKIVVGDENQSLYQWRGAHNALNTINIDDKLILSKSFRFGQAIADVANKVLDVINKPQHHLTGNEHMDSQVLYGDPTERHVVLCRTNVGLLNESLRAIRTGKSIHVVGSLMSSVMLMESAWYLSIGMKDKVTHPTLTLFDDWNGVMEVAQGDSDMKMLVKRVEEFGSNIPGICDELKAAGETSRNKADVVLSTVHKFKGDQSKVVRLSDDFPDLIVADKAKDFRLNLTEAYCFFVAVTRAESKLYANAIIPQLTTWKAMLYGKQSR